MSGRRADPGIACYLLRLGGTAGLAETFCAQAFGAPERNGPLAIHRAAFDPAVHETSARAVLPPGERTRIEAMREPGLRGARLFAHAGLRLVLAQRLNAPPESFVFCAGPNGKPLLRDHPGTHVSIAWRRGIAAIAVSADGPVGIDVETAPPEADMAAVARWMFSADEAAALDAAPPEQRGALFLAAWTRKEALGKAAGLNLDAMRGRDTRHAGIALVDAVGMPGRYAALTLAKECPAWSIAWRVMPQSF